ncbi:hypothetical protein K488DRAFT_47717 [Vararia minispora EC-137]|uniref:Uncharacterized protein n=1 Tax=Vararia minispora EC-137 TaxID=1314806 RepID=A0ACB8QPR4_9AGAM|nr:hypothetical protein K488DRAFT_47717 [Vararia minispora EC-137]
MLLLNIWRATLAAVLAAAPALAQSSASSAAPSASQSQALSSTTFSQSTTVPSTIFSRSGASSVPVSTAAIPTVLNVTSVLTPSPTTSAPTSTVSASATPSATPISLDTKVDPAFGVLGAILILTGIPSAFLGHKNRWTSFFLVGFYTLSLVCFVLILRFGVLDAVNPPSRTVRGMFVLASFVAGVAGGGVTIFFWKATKYFIGAWGGFALGLFIQCFRDGGLIRPIALRWILYIGCAVVGFVLCTIPKIHYHILLVSTAFIGASSIMLGVDCYSTAGLKEFYIWNLGFRTLFPKFTGNGIQFPVSQTMQIELGLIGAIAVMGAAVQFRILKILQRKLKEITEEQRRRDAVDDAKAAERFLDIEKEKEEWSREHPTLGRHMRQESDYSGLPLMGKDSEQPSSSSPDPDTFGSRPRHHSGLSEFMTATPTDDEFYRTARNGLRTPSVLLPQLDLGTDIQDNVPKSYISPAVDKGTDQKSISSVEERKRKDTLLAEIEDIRRSIDHLKAESSDTRDRHPSFGSRRTLSYDLATAVLPEAAHARPPRSGDPRARINSMDMQRLSSYGNAIGRPSSAPLRDEEWDAYVRERKLLQPPQGVTAPIPTSTLPVRTPSPRASMSPAIQEALARRQRRESMMGLDGAEAGPSIVRSPSPNAVISPLPRAAHGHSRSSSYIPPTILPPKRTASGGQSPSPTNPQAPRTVTYEELTERHRQKMRELQAPVTREQQERADVEKARARWERSRVLERQDVERRQAEQAARPDAARHRHGRSLSADKLGAVGPVGSSSKRASVMKVEDWQRYQQQQVEGAAVPFPGERRASRRMSNLPSPRDPPT